MKAISYVLFLFLFLIVSCKSAKPTIPPPPPPTPVEVVNEVNVGAGMEDYDRDGIADSLDEEHNNEVTVGAVRHQVKNPGNKQNPIVKQDVVTIVDPQYSVGHIATKVPKEMTMGKSYLVKIRITKEKNTTVLTIGDRNIPIDDDNVNSIVTIEKISISPVMSANLIVYKGSFKIDTLSTEY
ncbi:MAG: hypothetical protein ABFD07_10995, partial [Methanobacterium sp.]